MSKKQAQQRGRCLVCREWRPAESLAWLVADRAGRVVCDLKGQLGGRRVSVCLERCCLDALAVGDLAQALGVDALDLSTISALPAQIRAALVARLCSLLGMAQRGHKLASGSDRGRAALGRAPARGGWLALVAVDASAEIARRLCRTAQARGVAVARCLTTAELGDSIGKSPRSIVVIEDSGLARAGRRIVSQLRALRHDAEHDSAWVEWVE